MEEGLSSRKTRDVNWQPCRVGSPGGKKVHQEQDRKRWGRLPLRDQREGAEDGSMDPGARIEG